MPLVLKDVKGCLCPAIFCDHCHDQINDAEDGSYLWDNHVPAPRPLVFVHRRCDRAFTAAHPNGDYGWTPLECLPIYLAHNLRVNPQEAEECAKLFELCP